MFVKENKYKISNDNVRNGNWFEAYNEYDIKKYK